ncbi:lysozyme inhibitor LprI family protein [Sphingomonas sp. LHG3406-1]|uniref:lysozyme inhibitor LprI family protein n=1 Tax=Sphingomonas sp. LHG3406-1 TaxID=2804617 RepID=UPI00262E5336|nr:lysozyme inhibitor LprI family protein [Sphingomonas sp. LHG3406-1]
MLLVLAATMASQNPCAQMSSAYEMRECGVKQLEAIDRDLQKSWERAISRARTEDRLYDGPGPAGEWAAALTKSQQNWNRYRDAQCTAESLKMRPGNGTMGLELNCRIRMGQARITELEVHFDFR